LYAILWYHRCAFTNAAADAQPGSAEALAAKDFRTRQHELFTLLVAAAGYQNVPTLSLQLVQGRTRDQTLCAGPRSIVAMHQGSGCSS
jgi:hypothetical protein